jgi:hypothetical protein
MEGQDDALGESRREGGGEGGGEGGQAVTCAVIAGLAERLGPQGGGEEREGMQGDLEKGRREGGGEGGGKGGRNEAMWEGKGARGHCGLKGKIRAKAMQIWEKWEKDICHAVNQAVD